MNLLDHEVVEILGAPYESYGKWWALVKSVSWGREQETAIMFNTKEEAENVKPGYKYVA